MALNPTTKLFISHSSKDFEKATELCSHLERIGVACWMAPRNIPSGSDYVDSIIDGIRNSETLLVLLSSSSDFSDAVKNEVEIASRLKKPRVGVLLDDHKYSDFFSYHLDRFQMLRLPGNPSTDDFQKVALDLKTSLAPQVETQTISRDFSSPVKHNLPGKPNMIGRSVEFHRGVACFNLQTQVLSISGMTGIGKKTLASAIGHHFVDNNVYDMIIWLNAENTQLTLSDILDQMALISGDQYIIRLNDKEKEYAALNLLQTKSCVFIINGYSNIDDELPIQFIKKINYDDAVILTSDAPLEEFTSVERIHLSGLSVSDTKLLALLEASRIGLYGLETASDDLFTELRKYTSGNPYAIKLSIGQIKSGIPIERVLYGLSRAKGRVFEDVYSKVWALQTQEAKSLLFALSCFVDSASFTALQKVSQLDEWDTMDEIQKLTNASLIETNNNFTSSGVRYSLLKITESYVLSKANDFKDYREFNIRFLKYFFDFVVANHDNFQALLLELENIRFMLSELKIKDFAKYVESLKLLYSFYRDTGFWEEAIEAYSFAIQKLESNADNDKARDDLSDLRTMTSSFYLRQGSDRAISIAEELLHKALSDYTTREDADGKASVLGRLGRIYQKRGEYNKALEHSLLALDYARSIDKANTVADLEHEIGDEYFALGKYDEAEQHYTNSFNMYTELGEKIRLIGRYNDLGKLYLRKGNLQLAEDYLTTSITLATDNQKLDTLCKAKILLGELKLKIGDLAEAKKLTKEGYELAKKLKASDEQNTAEALLIQIELLNLRDK